MSTRLKRLQRSALVLAVLALLGLLGHQLQRPDLYSVVWIDAPQGLELTYINQVSSSKDPWVLFHRMSSYSVNCADLIARLSRAALERCPTCRVRTTTCSFSLNPELQDDYADRPISQPSARAGNGVIVYRHADPHVALESCLDSERQASPGAAGAVPVCYPAGADRPYPPGYIKNWGGVSEAWSYVVQGLLLLGLGLLLVLGARLLTAQSPIEIDPGTPPAPAAAPLPSKGTNMAKRLFDVVMSIAVLLVLSPLLALVTVGIYVLEGLPIFYVSRRYVSRHQLATIIKFRTMVADATSPKYRLNERFMRDGYLDIPLDCEVFTGIGRILERTQVVEILQLFNILFNGMSLIGNRPLPGGNIRLLARFPGWENRFDSPAGLSGLSQIVGKLNQAPEQRLELERLYAAVYTSPRGNILKLDFWIIYYSITLLVTGEPIAYERALQIARDALRE